MKWQALIIGAAAGLLLSADQPKKGDGKAAKDQSYYAKVEIHGFLETMRRPDEPLGIFLPRHPPDRPRITSYPMSVSKLKNWTEEKLRKFEFDGKEVRVTGTLEYVPVMTRTGMEERLMIVAETLEFVAEKDKPAPPKP
jgi:hypothetical protein